jgi:hypothetical protein
LEYTEGKIKALSTRGGLLEKSIVLGKKKKK